MDELILFLERDEVHSIKVIQEKLNFNDFVITLYMCGEILIIQSQDFLPSSAVPRFSLHTYKQRCDVPSISCWY